MGKMKELDIQIQRDALEAERGFQNTRIETRECSTAEIPGALPEKVAIQVDEEGRFALHELDNGMFAMVDEHNLDSFVPEPTLNHVAKQMLDEALAHYFAMPIDEFDEDMLLKADAARAAMVDLRVWLAAALASEVDHG